MQQQQQTVNTEVLADLFGVSERQIERLVAGGVLDHIGTGRAYKFDLTVVVQQYATFLTSGVPLKDWAADK